MDIIPEKKEEFATRLCRMDIKMGWIREHLWLVNSNIGYADITSYTLEELETISSKLDVIETLMFDLVHTVQVIKARPFSLVRNDDAE